MIIRFLLPLFEFCDTDLILWQSRDCTLAKMEVGDPFALIYPPFSMMMMVVLVVMMRMIVMLVLVVVMMMEVMEVGDPLSLMFSSTSCWPTLLSNKACH